MESYKKKALQKSHIVLIQNLNLEILDYLFASEVLTFNQMEKIQAGKTDSEKRSLLLRILVETGGKGSFESFLKALQDTHQGFIAEEIKGQLMSLNPQDFSSQDDIQGASAMVCAVGEEDYERDVAGFCTGRKKDLHELLFQMTEAIKHNQKENRVLNEKVSQIEGYKNKYEDELKKRLEEKSKALEDAKSEIDRNKDRERMMLKTLFMQKDKIDKTTERIKRMKELEAEYKETHWINIAGRYKVVKMMRKNLKDFGSSGNLSVEQESPPPQRSRSLESLALSDGQVLLEEAPT